jgi:hypothetical protein
MGDGMIVIRRVTCDDTRKPADGLEKERRGAVSKRARWRKVI